MECGEETAMEPTGGRECTRAEVKKSTEDLLRDVDLEHTTKRQIRTFVEEKLGLTPGYLSQHAKWRKLVGDTIEQAIVNEPEDQDSPENKTKAGRKRKRDEAPKLKASKTQKKEEAPDVDLDEVHIKQLKQQLLACGVRRIWSKELAGLSNASEQIRHLKGMLTSVGLVGRFSQAKAKKLKHDRELEAEVEEIQRYRPPEAEIEKEKTKPSVGLDVGFLGDQSSSSE